MIWTPTKPGISARIDWAHPLSQGLVGCWLFNEAGGRPVDLVTKQYGAVSTNTAWKENSLYFPGTTNTAVKFDDHSSYAVSGNMTIFISFKWEATVLQYNTLFGRDDYGTRIIIYQNIVGGALQILSQIGTNLVASCPGGDNRYKWNSLMYTCNTVSGQKIYFNGLLVNSDTVNKNGSFINNNKVFFGITVADNYPYTGYISSTSLYSRTLNSVEAFQLHELTKGW